MSVLDLLSALFVLAGAFFFLAGTAGLLRFPDVYTRLHALTKADNLGLGLVVVGLILRAENLAAALQMFLTWGLALVVGATAAHLVANAAASSGIRHWRRR